MRKNFNIVWQDPSNIKTKNSASAKIITSNLIKETIKRSNEIKDQIIVVKLSSIVIEDNKLLVSFAENIRLLSLCAAKIFIIHDHTNLVGDTLEFFGFTEKVINSVKVADYKSSQIMEMVLSGYINKLIVSELCNAGCYAVGISGKDANLIQAKKAKILRKISKKRDLIDIGFTSEPIMINPEILLSFEDSNIIPVISPIASDEKGKTHLLDVNLTASVISSSIDADHLILMDKGLKNKDFKVRDVKTLQSILNKSAKDQKILSLIEAATSAIENNQNTVHFVNAYNPDAILLSIFKDHSDT